MTRPPRVGGNHVRRHGSRSGVVRPGFAGLPPLVVTLLGLILSAQAQEQDPFSINGGSILAMAGKNSVAVAVDKRFGSGPQVRALAGLVVGILENVSLSSF